MKTRKYHMALLLLGSVLAGGCTMLYAPGPQNIGFHPSDPYGQLAARDVTPIQTPAPVTNDGSLFVSQGGGGWSHFSDNTARAVGDVLTVRVAVNHAAENSASTGLSRDASIEAGIPALFGLETSFPGVGSGDSLSGTNPSRLVSANASNSFSGDGDTRRAGKVTADISAVVTQVFPNGNMAIRGGQSVLINHEKSLITVEGLVRASDIGRNNVVLSDRIANARIEVTGSGVVSDKQKPGFLMRLFDKVWPF